MIEFAFFFGAGIFMTCYWYSAYIWSLQPIWLSFYYSRYFFLHILSNQVYFVYLNLTRRKPAAIPRSFFTLNDFLFIEQVSQLTMNISVIAEMIQWSYRVLFALG